MNKDRAAMAIRADARSAGMVTSLTTRVSARWKSSKRAGASECVSIFPDGTRVPFVRTTTTPATRLAAVRAAKRDNAQSYNDRLKRFGAIGNGEND